VKHTSFKLKLAAQDVHQKLHNSIHGGKGIREQEEANHDRLLLNETERLVHRLVVDEDGEEGKDVEHVELRNTEELGGVAQAPVTKFVAQNGDNLLGLALLKQGIVDDNVLLPWQTVEVGVAVSAALATVDNVELRERELQLLSQVLDTGLDVTRFQGRKLVEQGQDNDGIDGDSEDLNEDTEEPQVVEERVASSLNDLENSADDGSSEDNSEHLTLEHIRNPETECLLVETKLLLKHEGVVVRSRQREDRRQNVETEDEDQSLTDFALEATREVARQYQATDTPELGEHITVDESDILDLTVETRDETELRLSATVCLDGEKIDVSQAVAEVWGWRIVIPDFDRKPFGRLLPQEPLEVPFAAGPCTDGMLGHFQGGTDPGRSPPGRSSMGRADGRGHARVARVNVNKLFNARLNRNKVDRRSVILLSFKTYLENPHFVDARVSREKSQRKLRRHYIIVRAP